jgi:hypothetical protein
MKTTKDLFKGAFATFFHFRAHGLSTFEAHKYVRQFCEGRIHACEYAANPLCILTRRAMEQQYNKRGHQGD